MSYNRKVLYQSNFDAPIIPGAAVALANGGQFGETVVQSANVIAHNMQYAAQVVAAVVISAFAQSPEQFAKPVPASLQRFPDLAPFGYAATTGPLRFSQSPDQFAKPYPIGLQRIPDLVPFGYAPTTGPLRFTQSPDLFAKPFPVGAQQYSTSFGYLAPSPFVPWNIPPWPEQFARAFNVSLQLPALFPIFPPPTATPTTFWISPSPERFIKPYPVNLQRFPDFEPRGAIVSTTPQGGYSELWWRIATPVPASIQQYSASFSFTPPAAVGGNAMFFSQSPVRFAMPLSPTLQQVTDYFGFTPSPLGFGKRRPLLLQKSSGTTFGGGASYWPDGNG